MPLSISERLEAIAASNLQLAWDGCHKIYLINTLTQEDDAASCGYEILPASKIQDCWENTCGLEFVHDWDLGKHPYNIDQFEED